MLKQIEGWYAQKVDIRISRVFLNKPKRAHMSQLTSSRCTLKVKNFLTLKDVECDFAGVNCIIGPQAEGKSIIAKLVYFFFHYLQHIIRERYNNIDKKDFNKMFLRCFSEDMWKYKQQDKQQSFEINLVQGDNTITVTPCMNQRIHIQHCSTLENNIEELDSIVKNKKQITKQDFYEFIEENYSDISSCFNTMPRYIAETRMVYSAFLAKNVFRAINTTSGEWTIDPFLHHYMSQYEYDKNIFSQSKNSDSFDILKNPHATDSTFKSVLKGVYRVRDNEEYLIQDNNIPLPLYRTSAGQQEALPILLMLSTRDASGLIPHCLIIEEPEAHIFPTAQKAVMEYIVATYNRRMQRDIFCCTTHSPYLLSTLNNCITAHEVLKTNNTEKIAAMEKILPRDKWIPFEDVRCYYLEGGTIKSLMDAEFRVIDGSPIDTASEALSTDLARMLDILE